MEVRRVRVDHRIWESWASTSGLEILRTEPGVTRISSLGLLVSSPGLLSPEPAV
jgi:hypothetical protein